MTLVVAYIGKKNAVMAGDMREITFEGDKISREKLEKELYNGSIASDEELEREAGYAGVKITIMDDKTKVTQRDGILVGEVSSIEEGVVRKRRLYASAGNYIIAEIKDSEFEVKNRGNTAFIVLGNDITKGIANECIKKCWTKNRKLEDAIKSLIMAMETAAMKTASVSKKYILVQTSSKTDLSRFVEKDIGD
ncbi:MAG: DUF2121 domain-containing protein [Methanosarcinaceae archaeon]|nr:DUF2121 domain-containing protein [Methanosarcinaceae archaeon]